MLSLTPLVPPLLILLAALVAAAGPGRPRPAAMRAIEALLLLALLGAGLAVAQLVLLGPATSGLLGVMGLGASVRLDAVSATMLLLVAFIGWVVGRFAITYLDGEARQGAFLAWLCATLAAVLMVVIAGNLVQLVLAWIATSLCLQRLLLFYPDRPAARRAAAKKAVIARLGETAMIAAAALLFAAYGTGDIATINAVARTGEGSTLVIVAAGLLAVSALLRSAQFPVHGWLTEVMEAPTPVSALLHAGVINAGGFVLIRLADVMLLAPGALAALVIIGGFTALFGGLVMLTQPAVKTSLAWSTIAQMGFLLMQCGLALFPLALLHIVAHSLYKAHGFLAAGGAVDRIAAFRRPGPVAIPDGGAVLRAFLAALAIYAAIAIPADRFGHSPQALALGAILIFGVAYLLAQGLAEAAPRALTWRLARYAVAASIGYFGLHILAGLLTVGTLPPPPAPGPLQWLLMVLAMFSFGMVAVAQAMLPLWASHPATLGLRVHLANGLYLNALLDRWLGGWRRRTA